MESPASADALPVRLSERGELLAEAGGDAFASHDVIMRPLVE